ncbi:MULTISPECIES: hypothetical protein [Streptomyces]|uniref:hypothetical protein n=1 Tax=Streptomyces TaxID=1883 RepID=UPI00067E6175|nr:MULTISPECIES: hypothetical protein [Streptomyces]
MPAYIHHEPRDRRARRLKDAWIGQSPASRRDQQQTEQIALLRRQLGNSRQERRRLQEQVDAAATVISLLLAENTALREQTVQRSAVIVPLARP